MALDMDSGDTHRRRDAEGRGSLVKGVDCETSINLSIPS